MSSVHSSSPWSPSSGEVDEDEESDEGALETEISRDALPFYFSVPRKEVLALSTNDTSRLPHPLVWTPSRENPELGLPVYTAPNVGEAAKLFATPSQPGLVRAGDVVVSFHPETGNTFGMTHLQMGVRHVEFGGRMAPTRWLNDPSTAIGSFHILRPRVLDTPAAQVQVQRWISAASNAGVVNGLSKLDAPSTVATPAQITTLGRALLRRAATGYSSAELAFGVLGLAKCSETDLQGDAVVATCVQAPFAPEGMFNATAAGGAFDGPLLSAGAANMRLTPSLLDALLASNGDARVTMGMRDRAASFVSSGLSDLVRKSYEDRQANPAAPLNVPPQFTTPILGGTSFVVDAVKPRSTRGLDYVATVTVKAR